MDRSLGFGSTPSDCTPYSDSISLRLPYSVNLATECKSLTHYTKGTQSPLTRLLLFVCTRFQDLFHSPSGVLFAFPSRYWFTIGRLRVFSLGGWSPHVQTGFRVRGYHPLWPDFPFRSTIKNAKSCRLVPFRSPLLWESRLISFPAAT